VAIKAMILGATVFGLVRERPATVCRRLCRFGERFTEWDERAKSGLGWCD